MPNRRSPSPRPAARPTRRARTSPTWCCGTGRIPACRPSRPSRKPSTRISAICPSGVPGDSKFIRLADDSVRAVSLPAESKVALGTDVREYELMGNLDGRRFEDVYVVDPVTGERKLAVRKARWFRGASPDGSPCCSTTTARITPTTPPAASRSPSPRVWPPPSSTPITTSTSSSRRRHRWAGARTASTCC